MLPLHGLNAEKQPIKGDFWGLSGGQLLRKKRTAPQRWRHKPPRRGLGRRYNVAGATYEGCVPCSLNTAHTLFCRPTGCYSLLLVVEDVLLELLVPALEFFELILQGCLVFVDERLLVLRLQVVELLRTAYILIALRLDGCDSNFLF